jgi:hypothetical protein
MPRTCRSESYLSRPRQVCGRVTAWERHGICELASAVQIRLVGDLPVFGTVGEWQGRGRVLAGSRQGNGMVCVNRSLQCYRLEGRVVPMHDINDMGGSGGIAPHVHNQHGSEWSDSVILGDACRVRLSNIVESTLEDCQMGFRLNQSTIDNLFIVRKIIEKCHAFNVDVQCFYRLHTNIDSVYRDKIKWLNGSEYQAN